MKGHEDKHAIKKTLPTRSLWKKIKLQKYQDIQLKGIIQHMDPNLLKYKLSNSNKYI